MSGFTDDFTTDYFASGRYALDPSSNHYTVTPHHASIGELVPGVVEGMVWQGYLSWNDPLGELPLNPMPTVASIAEEVSTDVFGQMQIQVGWIDLSDPDPSRSAYLGGQFSMSGPGHEPSPALTMNAHDGTLFFGEAPQPSWDAVDVPCRHPVAPFTLAFSFNTPDQLILSLAGADGDLQTLVHTLPADLVARWITAGRILRPTGGGVSGLALEAEGTAVVLSSWGYDVEFITPGLIAANPTPGGIIRTDQQAFIGAVAGAARGAF